MIILHLHLQLQFKYELFHIYFTSWVPIIHELYEKVVWFFIYNTFNKITPFPWKLNRYSYGVQFGINCTALDQSKLSNFVEYTISKVKRPRRCLWNCSASCSGFWLASIFQSSCTRLSDFLPVPRLNARFSSISRLFHLVQKRSVHFVCAQWFYTLRTSETLFKPRW